MSTKAAAFTEAEATGRACHRMLTPSAWAPCMGSKCMAWRWFATHSPEAGGNPETFELRGDVYGYCGLAGDPMGWSSP